MAEPERLQAAAQHVSFAADAHAAAPVEPRIMAADNAVATVNLPLVFDGHNDLLSRLLEAERAYATGSAGPDHASGPQSFFEQSQVGHIDLPRSKEGRFGGGLF